MGTGLRLLRVQAHILFSHTVTVAILEWLPFLFLNNHTFYPYQSNKTEKIELNTDPINKVTLRVTKHITKSRTARMI